MHFGLFRVFSITLLYEKVVVLCALLYVATLLYWWCSGGDLAVPCCSGNYSKIEIANSLIYEVCVSPNLVN